MEQPPPAEPKKPEPEPAKVQPPSAQTDQQFSRDSISVSQRKQMFEQQGSNAPVSTPSTTTQKKQEEAMSLQQQNHVRRGQIVSGIFTEFETKNMEVS